MRFVWTVFLQNYIENADEFCARRHSLFLFLNLAFIVLDTAKLNDVCVSEFNQLFGSFLASSSTSAIYEYHLRLVGKLCNFGCSYFLVWNVYRSGDMTFGILVGSAHVKNYIVFLIFHHLNCLVHAYLTETQR